MTELQRLLDQIRRTRDCKVAATRGHPALREGDRLPDDLAEFYRLAGGATLFEHSTYPIRIVGPEELIRANPEIVGSECPDDISDAWYIVARGGREEAISIDCNADRLGRCYDSFWDRHGVAGDCRIVALSFTELLQRLLDGGGSYWYWLGGGTPSYGDAYGG
ncbi:MAG: SMI1/KNR4 family protein [Nannocystaceae bacterium]|nr:SMI1/KNR4 family protein [Nannocystaceae bacterium]